MRDEIEEIDDEQFEQLLSDKNHKQLIGMLRELNASIRQNQEVNTKIAALVERSDQLIKTVASKLSEIKIEAPEVKPQINITTNQDKVVGEIAKMAGELKNNVDALREVAKDNKKPHEWVFDIKRDDTGHISSVTAKPK